MSRIRPRSIPDDVRDDLVYEHRERGRCERGSARELPLQVTVWTSKEPKANGRHGVQRHDKPC